MSRPLRIEFPGAVYHLTARGDRREPIFEDDSDRRRLLGVWTQALARFDAQAWAYCLMGNHYHLVLQTRAPNLSRLMRHINGVYSQAYNRRHAKVGHVFQGRFHAVLVNRDEYLLALCRYVELNPVRAGLIDDPANWNWSSYRAHVGQCASPKWLDTPALHSHLIGRELRGLADRQRAAAQYARLVASAPHLQLWDTALRQQIYLGDEAFVTRMQQQALPHRQAAKEVPRTQREPSREAASLDALRHLIAGPMRDVDFARCYRTSGLSMRQIAAAVGLSGSTVSRRVARGELET